MGFKLAAPHGLNRTLRKLNLMRLNWIIAYSPPNGLLSLCHWFAGDSGQSVSTEASSHRTSIFGRSQKLYFLQFLTLMWLNGVELLVGMDNGFHLRIEVTGNHRLGNEILLTPHRLVSTLHEAPPTNIHREHNECYCFLPGRAFFLGCRSLIVQGEKKALESMLLHS